MRKVHQDNKFIADLAAEPGRFLMRQFEKAFEDSQFMHHFERRRMDRVTAKVAQKIFMLFEHDDIDACTCQQKAKHHARRTAAGDATSGNDLHLESKLIRLKATVPFDAFPKNKRISTWHTKEI